MNGPDGPTIAPGLDHACGITTADDLYCWGRNTAGELGAPPLWAGSTASNSPMPVAVGQ